MCKLWYDYDKPKYDEKAELCYIDTDSFAVLVKEEDIYIDIAEDAEARFGTSNFEIERPLPKGENKNVTGIMKNELGG